MMNTAKKSIKYVICLLAITLRTEASIAQDPGVPGGPDYDPDTEVPLDGGASLLLLAGAIYGAKKLRRKRID